MEDNFIFRKIEVKLSINPKSYDQLTDLKSKTGAANIGEVIANALKLYDGIIAVTEQGKIFLTLDANGETKTFRMFKDDKASF